MLQEKERDEMSSQLPEASEVVEKGEEPSAFGPPEKNGKEGGSKSGEQRGGKEELRTSDSMEMKLVAGDS